MDKEEALTIANKYLEAIGSRYVVIQAILFGSFARDTFHQDSDIDIALVMRNIPDVIDTQIELMKLRRDIDLRIEPHPFRENDFEPSNPMVNEILKYGIPLPT